MQVRRFEALTMKDALSAVKRELGQNAVILSTRELPDVKSGVKLFEVTAAASVTSKPGAEMGEGRPTTDFDFGPELLARLAELTENLPTRSQMRVIEGAVRDVKSMLTESFRGRDSNNKGSAHLHTLERLLKTAQIDDAIVADLLRHLHSLPAPSEVQKSGNDNIEDYYRDQAIRWMIKRIKIAPKWNATPGITNIHAFIGNSGVGKTSLMAKLATAIKRKERHKIALVSFDPTKVGNSESMRIYAKVLDVPHFTISKPHDLKKVVMAQKSSDLVLLDTPGRNPFDADAASDFEILKNLGLSIDFHLIVSAAEKLNISERAIAAFSSLAISSVSMTKLDECPAYGDLFNMTSRWTLPISYLVYSGQPADGVERATREVILERIFNT
jgi:flagellar biosynthesis protein FlhF